MTNTGDRQDAPEPAPARVATRRVTTRWQPRWPGPEKVVPFVLLGFLGLLVLTIVFSAPERPQTFVGTAQACVRAQDLAIRRTTPWFDCTVVWPGQARPVNALSRRVRQGEVRVEATRHAALGTVTYVIVD
jgi:hypothetical protein